jgi:hypothetical protein
MLAPYGGTSEAMTVLGAEAKKRGLLPFMNFNRLHVVPPCTVSEEEARTGLGILDEVFTEVDRYYEGRATGCRRTAAGPPTDTAGGARTAAPTLSPMPTDDATLPPL